MKVLTSMLCGFVLTACCSLPALADTVLYSQSSCDCGTLASQTAAGSLGAFAIAYDNFSLSQASTIDSMQWIGTFFNPDGSAPAPITSFTIDFYSDNAGQVGNLISTTTVAGDADETLTSGSNSFGPEYEFSGATSFSAAANTEYWISIVANMGFPPQWGWDLSAQGDGLAYQNFQGTLFTRPDVAFTLDGTPVVTPEPSSLLLAATGMLSAAGALRRRLALRKLTHA